MKVIKRDNYGRDYHPESLMTVHLDEWTAKLVADKLNESCSDEFYFEAVDDDYSLALSSMYDVANIERPADFINKQYGLKVFENDKNLVLDKELLKSKTDTELKYLNEIIFEELKRRS